jgi:hypothetical protein
LARTGDAPLAFLHCNGYKKDGNNCSRYFDKEGKPTYENRYDIRNWSDRPHPEQQQKTLTSTTGTISSFYQLAFICL